MKKAILGSTLLLAILGTFWWSAAVGEDQPDPKEQQAKLKEEFKSTMSNATLSGFFTVTGMETKAGLKEEKYTLGDVYEDTDGKWVINARIQYGDHDVTLPIKLDVIWAGDTPVIELTDLPVPGLGTFTARVLIYRDQYAGTWSGGDHGGHLFGKVVHAGDEKGETKKPASKP